MCNPDKRVITEITTDTFTAKKLLEEYKIYQKANGVMQDWYNDMTNILF